MYTLVARYKIKTYDYMNNYGFLRKVELAFILKNEFGRYNERLIEDLKKYCNANGFDINKLIEGKTQWDFMHQNRIERKVKEGSIELSLKKEAIKGDFIFSLMGAIIVFIVLMIAVMAMSNWSTFLIWEKISIGVSFILIPIFGLISYREVVLKKNEIGLTIKYVLNNQNEINIIENGILKSKSILEEVKLLWIVEENGDHDNKKLELIMSNNEIHELDSSGYYYELIDTLNDILLTTKVKFTLNKIKI